MHKEFFFSQSSSWKRLGADGALIGHFFTSGDQVTGMLSDDDDGSPRYEELSPDQVHDR